MIKAIVCAAAIASCFALTAPAPAQASMINPGLSQNLPSSVIDVQYRHHSDRRDHRSWRHHRRYRHCWTHRYRVRHHHRWVWRTVRRCGWRYR